MAGTQGGSLRRSLGLGSLTFYGVGLILGAGIYSILGEAAGIAGEALWQSFLLGSLAALLTGLSYAELATMFPRAGAEYVYLGEAWPGIPWLSGALGWVLVVAGCAILEAILDIWPAPRLGVADRGIREGILRGLMSADAEGLAAQAALRRLRQPGT